MSPLVFTGKDGVTMNYSQETCLKVWFETYADRWRTGVWL